MKYDKALKKREKALKKELRSASPGSVSKKQLDVMLKNKQYIKAKNFAFSQLQKAMTQTASEPMSQGYYQNKLVKLKKRFPKW